MCDVLTATQRKSVEDFKIYSEKLLSDKEIFKKIMNDAGFLTESGKIDWQTKCEDHLPFRSCDVFNSK